MNIAQSVKTFFVSISLSFFQLLKKSLPPPPPPSPTPTTPDLEMQPPPSPPVQQPQQQPLSTSINLESQLVMNMGFAKKGLEWQNVIMAFCFTSALEIALSAATHPKVDLPLSIYLLSFATTFIFASLFVSKFIASKFPTAARVLEKVAILLAVTAFFLTISIPMPVIFKCAAWAIYLISMLIIAICNCL